MTQPNQGSDRRDFWRGLGLTFLLHFIVLGIPAGLAFMFPELLMFSGGDLITNLLIAYMWLGGFGLWGIGIVQLLYMVPAIKFASRRQRPGIARGLRFGRTWTLLINGAIWGIILWMTLTYKR